MARYLLIAIFITMPLWLSAQVLNGRVYRVAGKDSSGTVANASVYYSGSMTGTLTMANGTFAIEAKENKIPLIVSCIGYYSTTVTDYIAGKPLKIYLKPKLHELREVHIGFDGMSRAEKVALFKREFIGTSDYAQSCTITNMDDVELDYNKKTGTLTAFCDGPIKIENKKLGYHISYFLDGFVRMPKEVKFSGNFIFSEDPIASKQKKTIRNREDAYSGSRMEFVRALWSNSLKKAHYKIYTGDLRLMDADSIICLNDHLQPVINLKYRMVILHNNNYAYPSQLSQTISDCYIDKNGFHDTGLQWFGDIGLKRVGDMLPFEYKSVKELSDSIHVADSAKVAEKVKIQKAANVAAQSKIGDKALKDFALFKSIVLSPKSPIDPVMVVKKWTVPIRYKVYGRFGADKARSETAMARVDSLFAQVAKLTGLSITKTDVDSDVNFYIVTEDLSKTKGIVSPEAIEYFDKSGKGGEYYTSNENGFSSMVELVRPANLFGVQRHIMDGLGFTGSPEGYVNSIFFDAANNQPATIQKFDTRVIQTLYNPAVKPWMTETELDAVLVKIFEDRKFLQLGQESKVADKPLFHDPVYDGAADPALIWNKKAKKWYMLYTNRRATDQNAKGVTWVHGTRIGIAESADGAHWKYVDTANIAYRPDSGFTHWAPALIENKGLYHMYLTYVPGTFIDWNHPRYIVHLTSTDLRNWKFEAKLNLANEKVIDPYVVKIGDNSWRMFYNNEKDGKSIYYADSNDLYNWMDKGMTVHDMSGEGPIAFAWKGHNWLIVDNWKGMGVYCSSDWQNWKRQSERLLEKPGTGKEDGAKGSHADVVINNDRAYIYYFVQIGKHSWIQVTELKYQPDGTLTCNRDEPTQISLTAPK